MGQVVALCTSDETEDRGYNKTTVEKVRPAVDRFLISPDLSALSSRVQSSFGGKKGDRFQVEGVALWSLIGWTLMNSHETFSSALVLYDFSEPLGCVRPIPSAFAFRFPSAHPAVPFQNLPPFNFA